MMKRLCAHHGIPRHECPCPKPETKAECFVQTGPHPFTPDGIVFIESDTATLPHDRLRALLARLDALEARVKALEQHTKPPEPEYEWRCKWCGKGMIAGSEYLLVVSKKWGEAKVCSQGCLAKSQEHGFGDY